MIEINQRLYHTEYFPDGTQRLKLDQHDTARDDIEITWKYADDGELFTVLALAKSYRNMGKKITLNLPYVPNARMDRVKSENEIFTLKIFCELINAAGFSKIRVLDVHSNVTLALLDHVEQVDVADVIRSAALDKLPKDVILYFPDEGSQKRYGDLFPEYRHVIGMKKRDWETGTILGLDVQTNGIELAGKTVLMIDDIVSYGGSLYYSALKLKELGAEHIYAYATHTELSVTDEEKGTLKLLLDADVVEKLFTTDSLFNAEYRNIEVYSVKFV